MTSARGIAAVSAAIFACLLPLAAPAAARRARPCGAAALAGAGRGHHRRHRHRRHHHHPRRHHPHHRRHRGRHRRGTAAGACSTRRSTSPLVHRSQGGTRGFFTPVLLPARIASTGTPPSEGSPPQPAAAPQSSHGAAGIGPPEGGTSEERLPGGRAPSDGGLSGAAAGAGESAAGGAAGGSASGGAGGPPGGGGSSGAGGGARGSESGARGAGGAGEAGGGGGAEGAGDTGQPGEVGGLGGGLGESGADGETADPGGAEGGAGTPLELPAVEEPLTEEQPPEERPTEERPPEERLAEERLPEERPAEEQPPEERPAEEQPAEEVPTPTEEAPTPTEEAPTPPAEEVPTPPRGERGPPTEEGGPAGGSSEPFRFFSPTSVWNEAPPVDAAIDPASAAIVGALASEVAHEEEIKKGPAINTTAWSVPIYTVPADQPTVKVTLSYASTNPTLQSAWEAVPLPADAKPASGTDKHLVVWQPSSKHLWEFWHLEKKSEGWEAYWGGAIQNASSATGAYELQAWPGAKTSWGASASSLSIAGGLITLEDLEKGTINHALAIAVPDTRAKVFAAPAQRTDGGSSEATSLPEGAHLRLNPRLDLAALHLPRFTLMLAEAAQKYGLVVRDTAANVALYAQDPTPTGLNPYLGKSGFYEGKSPAALLAAFPWSELQLLKMELRP